MSSPPEQLLPSLDELTAEVFTLAQRDQTAGQIHAPGEVSYRDLRHFFGQIRNSERRFRILADKLRFFLKKYHHPLDRSNVLSTVQAARICAFESERGIVFVSAAAVATIIARCEGDAPIVVEADIPVIWIPEQDMIQVAGSASWDEVIPRLGYTLLSVSFHEWSDEPLLAAVRQVFPNAELQPLDSIEETINP